MSDHTNASKLLTLADLGSMNLTKVNSSYGSCNFCIKGNPRQEDVYLLQAHMTSLRLCPKCLQNLHILVLIELNKIQK